MLLVHELNCTAATRYTFYVIREVSVILLRGREHIHHALQDSPSATSLLVQWTTGAKVIEPPGQPALQLRWESGQPMEEHRDGGGVVDRVTVSLVLVRSFYNLVWARKRGREREGEGGRGGREERER